MVQKTALDETAKSYWSEYFGEYGKLWVRDIPRNIRAALEKTAGFGKAADADEDRGWNVAPIAHAVTADRVILDGVYRDSRQASLFRAEFNHDGTLLAFEQIAAPAA